MQNLKSIASTVPGLENASSGIGLREGHYEDVLTQNPAIGFLEAHSENYFKIGSVPFEYLIKFRESYPVSLHGVGLSLGSADGMRDTHLEKLKTLVDIIQPVFVSEHISWSGVGSMTAPDLLPLPLTAEALKTVIASINQVQDKLQRRILVENPSSYLAFKDSEMTEPEFLAQIVRSTDCHLLLDLNNIHVSAHNIGFDAMAYLRRLPKEVVKEMHLAGYQINHVEGHEVYIDAHNQAVYEDVWKLYAAALDILGDTPTLIEWDSNLPALATLVAEAHKADALRAHNRKNAHAA